MPVIDDVSVGPSVVPTSTSTSVSCSHCGLVVPPALVLDGAEHQFCCTGCHTVFEAIRANGLERYYQLQSEDRGNTAPAKPTGRGYSELDDREFLDLHAPQMASGLRCTEFYLEGVHCSACVWLVERLPRIAPGVLESRLDMRRALVKVVWEDEKVQLSQIARTLDSLGYTPHPGRDSTTREMRKREDRNLLVRMAIAGAGAGNVMLLAFALYGGSFHGMEHEYSSLFRWMSMLIGLTVLLWPGSLFFRGAWAAIRTRAAHLDLPIAIGLAAGAVAGTLNTVLDQGEIYFDSLTGLVFLLLVGRYIQRRLERRASDAVEMLFSLTPSFARLRTNGESREIPIEALKIEDIVEVLPGESFPADGAIVEGDSSVDLALLTGESRPVPVTLNDRVFAGAVNVARPLLTKVNALGRETRIGKLLTLMEECAARKAPIVRLADRMAGYFTIGAMGLFVATMIGWHFIDAKRAVDNALSLLIVTCPCGLGLATPFAVSVALGRAARNSILIKGGEVLEKLGRVSRERGTVFLDKTGTLTEPGLAVVEWHGDTSVREALATLEAMVSHPVARAIAAERTSHARLAQDVQLVRSARQGIVGTVDGATMVAGAEAYVLRELATRSEAHPKIASEWATRARQALTEKGLTPVWVSLRSEVIAVIGIGSRLRDDATKTLQVLGARGLMPVILSGDDPETVRHLGEQLQIPPEHCHGGLSPEDKLHIVQRASTDRAAIMVGDGINDAAALSAANVGIAVHGGAEASLAAADVYLGRPGIGVLVELLEGSARTIAVIRRCLRVSLAYNVVAAVLAVTGVISPLIAAILMPIASFTVLGIALLSKTFPVAASAKVSVASLRQPEPQVAN